MRLVIWNRGEFVMYVRAQIKDFPRLKKKLEDMKEAPKKVLESTFNDAKKRVPSWVAAEVSKVYGIKKAEIGNGEAGQVKVRGNSLDDLTIIYSGRMLSPSHFGMTPKAPGANAYTLKAEIIRGQRVTLGKVKKLSKEQRAELGKNFRREGTRNSNRSPIMLMHTGNQKASGTDYIPFQRKSTDRKDIEAVKSISLPQMVSSERAAPGIRKAISEGLEKRLDHNMERYMGKI
ncbi:MAG: serine/arginine repetitive matrix protein 2 [Clostridiales bacterium]|nr:serine/arginine repetitive matrix protein 2 [Clostridiales bacterium]